MQWMKKCLYRVCRFYPQLLYKHFGQKTVILIDEYDVPLDKAFQNGFTIKRWFHLSEDSLERHSRLMSFCSLPYSQAVFVYPGRVFLQVSTILEINSIVDIAHDEQFGFTDDEVRKSPYGL